MLRTADRSLSISCQGRTRRRRAYGRTMRIRRVATEFSNASAWLVVLIQRRSMTVIGDRRNII